MANYANLPAPTPEGGLNRYMQEIRKFPLLEPEEEYMLAKAWVEKEDTGAAHKLLGLPPRQARRVAPATTNRETPTRKTTATTTTA